jgi:aminoglycoside phosphotransferase family enzyme/predicted kinase
MSVNQPAAVAETHISVIVFLGDRAYKVKKPVSLGFLDFSTREARLAACRSEVELNRRLAPDVYLGVADVTGPDGELCDHLVVMRRMPPERRLSTLVSAGAAVDGDLRRIAQIMAAFHAAADDRSPEIGAAGRADAILARWESNFVTIAPLAACGVVDAGRCRRIEELARRYLAGREPLFSQRISDGFVRDGHGDLQADDIFCLADGPRILDCIEFDPGLRHGDVLADVAFLAMDLERLGDPAAAARFLSWYAEFSGESHPPTLASHYIAYRAHVRAKVACLRHIQGDPAAAAEAESRLALAERHLAAGRVVLALVGGLPGTGKSTLAAGLGGRLGWLVLRSDVVRKELAGVDARRPGGASFQEGLYRSEMTAEVYGTMLDRARTALGAGESVILDASWTDAHCRAAAALVAEETSADLLELRCDAPPGVAAERIRRRERGDDPSDATPEVAAAMAARVHPWPSATALDTSGAPDVALATALAALRR